MKASDEVFILEECIAYAPDVPDLPQDEDFLCGDVNEDGLVNVLDIISMVNYIMGGNPSPFNTDAANINADGGINVLDIIALVNIIMQVPGMPCGCVAPVLYEGQTYATVQIGDQCWFRENLNVGTKINSTQYGYEQQDNDVVEKYCYNNDEANCEVYGGLYEWPEAMQYLTTEGAQGICPVGWHIATDGQWTALSDYLGGSSVAGGKIKSTGTIEEGTGLWYLPNTDATNESGFTGLPEGFRYYYDGNFSNLGYYGYFWSSSQSSAGSAWYRGLRYNDANVDRYDDTKEYGFSVRCLKGCWPEPTQANAGPDQVNVPGTSTTLAANAPAYGTGVWHIISGTGGVIADTTSPTSGFTGVADSSYLLTWTITTQCGSTEDTVVISFASVIGQPCPGIPTVEYEGQVYNTVQIGEQCWFKENLNVGTKINSNQNGYQQTNNSVIEKYCYDNDETNCLVYGGLYEWPEAMQYVTTEGAQGICPAGWHIPTDNEWKILEGTVDSQYGVGDPEWDGIYWRGYDAGGNLKETGTTHWASPNTGATNSSGFSGLPGGYRYDINGSFYYLGIYGNFWSSSQSDMINAWYRHLHCTYVHVYREYYYKDDGFSLRCLKGCWPRPDSANAGPDQLNVPGTSTTLAGNTPIYGTGLWTILNGTGGTIVTPTSPTSEFQGMAGNEYTLSWTITTACGSSADTLVVSFTAAGFTCGDDLLYEDQSYATVLIGTQCWMAENLNVGSMIQSNNGGFLMSNDGTVEKYCYNNDGANCVIYGGLYEWPEAMQYGTTEGAQGICPIGWHVPTDGECTDLTDYLGGEAIAGGKMKSTGTIEEGTGLWYTPNEGATNESGFTCFPGGCRENFIGNFSYLGSVGDFWSSSQDDSNPWFRELYFYYANVFRNYNLKETGLSVRCLKDD
ncbi:MAG: FISUMP domain-containing protein [Bacteroidales bacterium]|nr:FISUMP domain-containing protein [Bacteroidales bacterium]